MFDSLSERLGATLKTLRGQGRLTEANIRETMRDVRMALLEADVALPVVKDFVARVREQALGEKVMQSLSPGQALISIVQRELVSVLGESAEGLDLRVQPPAVILMAGLQGAGKTTTAAKIARLLVQEQRKAVMMVSCDVYRPAAIDQLATVGGQAGATVHPSQPDQRPVDIARGAMDAARKALSDVLIIDTAGRLAVDEEMMNEIKALHDVSSPAETLFVVDGMTGQDAVNSAKAFGEALALTGVVLTKVDGDARGGAALSVKAVTGKPIKFLGIGEKLEDIEVFHPDRIASRILGMGDVMSLIEEAERKVDKGKAEKLARKMQKGQGFDLADFREQLEQMQNMGGMETLLDKLPGGASLPPAAKAMMDDRNTRRLIAIINSMTPQERRFPAIIKASRKRRIASGSGTDVPEINRLLKQFTQMQKMMKKMKKGGMAKMMRGMNPSGGRGPLPF